MNSIEYLPDCDLVDVTAALAAEYAIHDCIEKNPNDLAVHVLERLMRCDALADLHLSPVAGKSEASLVDCRLAVASARVAFEAAIAAIDARLTQRF